MLKSKIGVCFDGKYNFPTHTFLIYYKKDYWNWFEFSFGDKVGIHEYKNKNDLFKDVTDSFFRYSENENKMVRKDDFCVIKYKEYKQIKYGCSVEEFLNLILKNK